MELVGDARFVLLGEASHGTHEFYRERARITRRLIDEKGFAAVAVEADWPDAYRVNRFLRGEGLPTEGADALGGFQRFPQWMWRNADVLDFVTDLRERNDRGGAAGGAKVGFYGLDLYSLHISIHEVIGYLDKVDPEAARRARERYGCFEMYADDPQRYGYATYLGADEPCEEGVVSQLVDLHRRAAELQAGDGGEAGDELFYAQQNARLVVNAEEYYRSMFRGRDTSWNLRDTHMAQTLDALVAHLEKQGCGPAKVVVWAHNSHLGDARATEMSERGELNVGQLVREHYDRDAVLVGFSTHSGTVTAASDWGEPAERKRVRPALEGSVEALLHETGTATGTPDFLLNLRDPQASDALREPRLERAIGVIYRPETERWSHYFHARVAQQFDVLLHFDETSAVEPLERTSGWETGEPPETYPTGI
jgi:erythromycin esterase-like protein